MEISISDKKYIERTIRSYEKKEVSKLDELRKLDKKATRGATIFSYIFGSVSSLILGLGMSIAMEVIFPGYMYIGIIIGLIGILLVSINYPLYKKLLEKGKRKYASQILELSNELLNY